MHKRKSWSARLATGLFAATVAAIAGTSGQSLANAGRAVSTTDALLTGIAKFQASRVEDATLAMVPEQLKEHPLIRKFLPKMHAAVKRGPDTGTESFYTVVKATAKDDVDTLEEIGDLLEELTEGIDPDDTNPAAMARAWQAVELVKNFMSPTDLKSDTATTLTLKESLEKLKADGGGKAGADARQLLRSVPLLKGATDALCTNGNGAERSKCLVEQAIAGSGKWGALADPNQTAAVTDQLADRLKQGAEARASWLRNRQLLNAPKAATLADGPGSLPSDHLIDELAIANPATLPAEAKATAAALVKSVEDSKQTTVPNLLLSLQPKAVTGDANAQAETTAENTKRDEKYQAIVAAFVELGQEINELKANDGQQNISTGYALVFTKLVVLLETFGVDKERPQFRQFVLVVTLVAEMMDGASIGDSDAVASALRNYVRTGDAMASKRVRVHEDRALFGKFGQKGTGCIWWAFCNDTLYLGSYFGVAGGYYDDDGDSEKKMEARSYGPIGLEAKIRVTENGWVWTLMAAPIDIGAYITRELKDESDYDASFSDIDSPSITIGVTTPRQPIRFMIGYQDKIPTDIGTTQGWFASVAYDLPFLRLR